MARSDNNEPSFEELVKESHGFVIEDDPDAPNELKIFGKVFGTFTGWDQVDTLIFVYYGFTPTSDLLPAIPAGDITVDYTEGRITWSNETEADERIYDCHELNFFRIQL